MYEGLRSVRLIGPTNTSGAATITAASGVMGFLEAVEWVDGTLDNNNTAVLSVTNTESEADLTLLTLAAGEGDADKWYFPRILEHDNGATALLTYTKQIINGTLKLVIASGGNTKTGGCIVYYRP